MAEGPVATPAVISAPANSAQEPTRGRSAGPPAEPAKESSERHGGTPPATRQAQWRQAACRVGFGTGSPLAAQCEALGRHDGRESVSGYRLPSR